MRLTPALYVRRWLAKLHPPLPQTPRESQQLLRMLEGSFRKHLDETHPSPIQRLAAAPQNDIPLVPLESSSKAAHHYFNTVLSNPLLARSSGGSTSRAPSTINAVALFLKAFHEGSADLVLLRRCAREYLQGVKKGEVVAEKDRLADKLASWVYTANSKTKEAFFSDSEALRLAVQVVGVDEQEAVAWDWLKILYERQFHDGDAARNGPLQSLRWLSSEDALVSRIMQLSLRRGALGDATQQFVAACQYRSDSGRASAELQTASPDLPYVPLEDSWKRLAASVIYRRSKHGMSESLFDQATTYGLSWSLAPAYSIPVISVYHPTSPSASSLTQCLQDSESASRFLTGQAQASKNFRKTMLTMILDGAQLSLEIGLPKEAQFLVDFAHTHYTEFLPPLSPKFAPSLGAQIRNAQGELRAHSYNFAFT